MSVTALLPSAARTTSGSSIVPGMSGQFVDLAVVVTAASGTTPSLAVSVEWSQDGVNFGPADAAADTFAAITTAATRAKRINVLGDYMRIVWTITGTTPSFTFSVTADDD